MTNSFPHAFFSRHWQAPEQLTLTPLEQHWLQATDSMTARLQALGKLSVQSLNETSAQLADDEADFLCLPAGSDCLLREVLLCVDAAPCIFARSLLPLTSLSGANAVLASMAARPLGSELFRAPVAERRLMQACRLPAAQLPEAIAATDNLLARRSLFFKNGLPLLVAECFLPALWSRL